MNGEELSPKPERRNGNGGGTAPKPEESGEDNASAAAKDGTEEPSQTGRREDSPSQDGRVEDGLVG